MYQLFPKDLKAVLPVLAKAAPKKHGVLPILECIHISAGPTPEWICLRATNLDTDLQVDVLAYEALPEAPAPILVPAAAFAKVVALAGDVGPITLSAEGGRVRISFSGETVTLPAGYDVAIYPVARTDWDETPVVSMPYGDLTKALKTVSPYMGKDEPRPATMGALIDMREGCDLVAMDMYRLIAIEPSQAFRHVGPVVKDVWVSAEAAGLLRAIKGTEDMTVGLLESPLPDKGLRHYACAEQGDMIWTLSWPLPDGRFPDWRTVLPELERKDLHLLFNGPEMLATLAKSAALGHSRMAVRMLPEEKLRYTSWDGAEGETPAEGQPFIVPATYRTELPCMLCDGTPGDLSLVAFDPELLKDVLKTEGCGPDVEMYFFGSSRGVLFGHSAGKVLLMPVVSVGGPMEPHL